MKSKKILIDFYYCVKCRLRRVWFYSKRPKTDVIEHLIDESEEHMTGG